MESDPDTLSDLLEFLANASPPREDQPLATPPLQRQNAFIEPSPPPPLSNGGGDRKSAPKSAPREQAGASETSQGPGIGEPQPPEVKKNKKPAAKKTKPPPKKDAQTSTAKLAAKKRPPPGEEIHSAGGAETPAVKKRHLATIKGKKLLERWERRLQRIKLPILPTCIPNGSDDDDRNGDAVKPAAAVHPYFLTRLPLVTYYQCGGCLRKSNASYSLIDLGKNADLAAVTLHFCQKCRNVNAQLTKALAYHINC